MTSINKVILIGNLGNNPEIRNLEGDLSVARFSIATTESFKDRNGDWQDRTEWHNVVAWRFLAERAEKYLKKGMQVYVEGKLTTSTWDDKDGNKRYSTEVVASNLIMLGKREYSEDTEEIPPPVEPPAGSDDLPF